MREFNPARCQKIEIGRSEASNIRMDYDQISRHHATIKLLYDDIHIEDHSSNGTYIYFDNREIFLSNNSIKVGKSGIISCGLSKADSKGDKNVIAYEMLARERNAA
jgi:pSer/pThr/pTyr-binding forkhead associated (FHA) protein